MTETHELDVSVSGKNSHNFCTTCSNRSMGGGLATTTLYAFSFDVGHEIDIHPLYSHRQVFGPMLLSYSAICYPLVDVLDLVHCLPCDFLRLQWMRLHYGLFWASLFVIDG